MNHDFKFSSEFSDFGFGFRNRQGIAVIGTTPRGKVTIPNLYATITSEQLRTPTQNYRALIGHASHEELSDVKKLSFPAVCVRGIFAKRANNSLTSLTKYIPIDIDGLASPEESREIQQMLIGDPHLDVALSFSSPSFGAKVIVELPDWCADLDPKGWYGMIADHIAMAHGIRCDSACKDLARATLICWDPQAYMNPKYHNYTNIK